MNLLRFFIIFFLLGIAPCHAQDDFQPPALRRGVNLSSWLANAPRQPLTQRDFAQIKLAGFDHVRLPFNPTYYGFTLSDNDDAVQALDLTALDHVIALAKLYNLAVILDVHPAGDFMETLERHGWAEKSFIELWTTLAEHYKSQTNSALVFELLNEPQYYKSETLWNKLAARSVEAIHKISPQRIIIVGGPHGSDIDGLSFLDTNGDPHVVYAFHFYEPYLVTHQGIHMGFEKKMIRFFRNMPYPSILATKSASIYAPDAPSVMQAGRELDEYRRGPWDANHIEGRVSVAHDWATTHHVRLLCGEFGVLRNHIDTTSRYQWIHDVRAALDADHIGWEVWDYADLFGIAVPTGATNIDPVDGSVRLDNPEKGSYLFDPQALPALGLGTAPR